MELVICTRGSSMSPLLIENRSLTLSREMTEANSPREPAPAAMLARLEVLARRAMLACIVAVLGISSGCTPESDIPETDEARKRSLAEGSSIPEAAEYYNYRTDKGDDEEPYAANQDRRQRRVYDYFAGMDAISFARDQEGNAVPSQHLQPDQRIDRWVPDANKPDENEPDEKEVAEAAASEEKKPPVRIETFVTTPELTENELIGRNTWMVWCGGNEGFWDWLANDSLGFIDLLKLVDSRKRDMRFRDAGMINEPGMRQATQAAEYGLWLDLPRDDDIRRWRTSYLTETFTQVLARQHKSQVGLKKGPDYDTTRQQPLFVGDPTKFKGEGYRYPSSYLSEEDDAEPVYGRGGKDAPANKYDATIPPPDMYGVSSGVIGLRLFPNPYFDEEAEQKWNPKRYYEDKSYYNDPDLVRPYRVGMSCAFCHTSFHPLAPPSDANNPDWRNLSGNIGAQYLSMRATVGGQLTPDQFVYHLLDSQPRGTIDTSLIASDNINNPNTMNAVFGLKERAILSLHNPKENLATDSATLPSLWITPDPDAPAGEPDPIPQALVEELESYYPEEQRDALRETLAGSNDAERHVPRILLDGSDSVGTIGALARVYLNIGSYWEQWNEVHQVVLGFTPQRPFKLTDCESNSVYWNATMQRMPGLRDYFLKVTPPMPLLSTEDASERLRPIDTDALKSQAKMEKRELADLVGEQRAQHVDVTQLAHGREVFAKNCIVCHSSIQPETAHLVMKDPLPGYEELAERRDRVRFAAEENGEFYEHDPAQWLDDPKYQAWAAAIIEKDEFWGKNYLSNDYRVAVTLVGTNSSRAMGTNGLTGHMWQDFASESYRNLPSPGEISFFNPYLGEQGGLDSYSPRHVGPDENPKGGGPGYYRVPTLISIWATAPLLHNNSLGLYNNDPSVNGRLDAFDDAIRKMLWPEKRLQSSSYNGATAERLRRDHGLIWRTPRETYLSLDAKRVPGFAKRLPILSRLYQQVPWLSRVYPLWLPVVILLVVSWVVLLVSNHKHRRTIGILLILLAIVFTVAFWISRAHPSIAWLGPIRRIYPYQLPLITALAAGTVLLLPLSRMWARRFGYLSLVVGLGIGTIVYFNAGKLGDVQIGPIPAGTPVNLLANFNSEADRETQVKSVYKVVSGLAEIESRMLADEDASRVMKEKVAPALMEVNKCPDFVMDRGHYFPWFDSMTDEDKNALIELLKTF